MQLSIKGLALALGVTWAISVFLLGLSAWLFNWGNEWVDIIATVYRGYGQSFLGALIGAVFAFIDGVIGGVLIAWFYNKFTKTSQ